MQHKLRITNLLFITFVMTVLFGCAGSSGQVKVASANYIDYVSPANGARGKMFEFEIIVGKKLGEITVDSLWYDKGRYPLSSEVTKNGTIRLSGSYMGPGPKEFVEGEVQETLTYDLPIKTEAPAVLRYWKDGKPFFLEVNELKNRREEGVQAN